MIYIYIYIRLLRWICGCVVLERFRVTLTLGRLEAQCQRLYKRLLGFSDDELSSRVVSEPEVDQGRPLENGELDESLGGGSRRYVEEIQPSPLESCQHCSVATRLERSENSHLESSMRLRDASDAWRLDVVGCIAVFWRVWGLHGPE